MFAGASSGADAQSSGASLLDLTPAEKRRRVLRKHDTEWCVERALSDNFKGWSRELTDLKVVSGKSLRQQLLDRKRLNHTDKNKYPMGVSFYNEMRVLCQEDTGAAATLTLSDESEVVDARLVKSMIEAKKKKHLNRAPLVGWISTTEKVNQRELVGIYRWALDLRVSASADQLRAGLEVMSMTARLCSCSGPSSLCFGLDPPSTR